MNMKKFSKRGFTLIELLIIIALLGALAVGLLAALDPFEQLKKGTDSGTRNTVSEIHAGVIRYYAIKQHMPWCKDAECNQLNDGLTTEPSGEKASNLQETIQAIIDEGELKKDFISSAGEQLNKIYVTGTNDPPEVTVCFKPISKSFQSNPNTKFKDNAGTQEDKSGNADYPYCKSNGGANECYWCIK